MGHLQKLRKAAGLSQSQLADKSGISWRTIQEYEQGRKRLNGISIERALPLARALGVTIEDLIDSTQH